MAVDGYGRIEKRKVVKRVDGKSTPAVYRISVLVSTVCQCRWLVHSSSIPDQCTGKYSLSV